MSKSVSFLFFIRNVLVASFVVLFSLRIATIFRFIGQGNSVEILDVLQGFAEDLWFLLIILFPIHILARFIFNFHEKAAKIIVFGFTGLLMFVQVGLTEYFLTVHQIVDASVFNFSLDELQKTVGLGERFSILTVLGLVLLIVVFVLVYRRMNKRKNKFVLSQSYFATIVGVFAWICIPMYNANKEISANELGIESNVSLLFLNSVVTYQSISSTNNVKRDEFEDLDPSFVNGEFVNSEYPIFRALDDKSVFGPLFNKSKKKPRLVYIIVEGLSSDFIGEKADLSGRNMPFLDSLSAQSLYYPNALSTSQRTQNVLPALLSSVPNVNDGIVFQQMNYPNHWSLQGLLRKDYSTSFYCGVPLEYMNMRGFMNEHSVNRLSGKWTKEVQKETNQLESPWGVSDGGLFTQHVHDLKKLKGKNVFDVLLTISTHDPYVYPNKAEFTKQLLTRMDKLSVTEYSNLVRLNAEKFASYAYTDAMLRKYFSEMQKMEGFENTIFVITGDHGSELWKRSAVSKYHVPIIIYSSLLKGPKKIESVVSHLDVAPTFHTFLKQEYGLQLPGRAAYMGRQLLVSEAKLTRSFAFTTDQLKMKDICYRGLMYIDFQLYKITKDLDLAPFENPALINKIRKQKAYYQKFSNYIHFGNHLLPNEDYFEYYDLVEWKELFTVKKEINKDLDHKSVVEIAEIGKKELSKKKLKIRVQIAIEKGALNMQDSLPDLVLSKESMSKMERKKAVYRMIRPRLVSQDKNVVRLNYVLIFDSHQLMNEKEMKRGILYLYYKMRNSPRVISAETVISGTK